MNRKCVFYDFQIKNYDFLTRHLNHCSIARKKKRRKKLKKENETIENVFDNEN